MLVEDAPDIAAERDDVSAIEPDGARPQPRRRDHPRRGQRVVGVDQQDRFVTIDIRVCTERVGFVRERHDP